ncbi:Ig-like domain-containing protein, partial [Methanobacterium veterum]
MAVLIFLSIASLSLSGVSATSETSNTTSSNITTNSTANLTATASSFSALSTADNSAPTVTSVDPVNNAVNVPVNKTIKITFSEPIKLGTSGIGVKNPKTGKYEFITKTISGNVLTITLNNNLTKATQYAIILNPGSITDLAGNPINAYGIRFTTDSTIPTVTSIDPANNAVNVPVNKTIKVTFSEPIKLGTSGIGVKNPKTGKYEFITKTI